MMFLSIVYSITLLVIGMGIVYYFLKITGSLGNHKIVKFRGLFYVRSIIHLYKKGRLYSWKPEFNSVGYAYSPSEYCHKFAMDDNNIWVNMPNFCSYHAGVAILYNKEYDLSVFYRIFLYWYFFNKLSKMTISKYGYSYDNRFDTMYKGVYQHSMPYVRHLHGLLVRENMLNITVEEVIKSNNIQITNDY